MSNRTAVAIALGSGLLLAGGAVFLLTNSGPKHAAPAAPTATTVRPPHPHPPALPSQASQRQAVQRLIALGRPVYCGGNRGRDVALTFDDGPGPYTRFALRLLRRNHARATFFVVGKELQWFPSMPRRETALAVVGDHTWTHPMLTKLSIPAVRSELARTKKAASELSGTPITLFRPPYADRSPAIDAVASKLGMVEVLWSVDSLDWQGATPPQILANVKAGLRPGSIVLMHENRGQTIKALKLLLPAIRRKHFHMVTVPELLANDPPSIRQLRRATGGCG